MPAYLTFILDYYVVGKRRKARCCCVKRVFEWTDYPEEVSQIIYCYVRLINM